MNKKEETDERTILSAEEQIALKRSGTSDVLRIPAFWRKTFPFLRGQLLFNCHVERDNQGHIFIIFEKIVEEVR